MIWSIVKLVSYLMAFALVLGALYCAHYGRMLDAIYLLALAILLGVYRIDTPST